MGNSARIKIIMLFQLVIGVSYIYKTVYIGFLIFNIQIDCRKEKMEFFQFENVLKRQWKDIKMYFKNLFKKNEQNSI